MQLFPCSFYILVKSLFPCGSVMYNSDYLFRFQSMRKAYPRIAGGNSSELPETASSRLVIILIVALYLSSLHIYLQALWLLFWLISLIYFIYIAVFTFTFFLWLYPYIEVPTQLQALAFSLSSLVVYLKFSFQQTTMFSIQNQAIIMRFYSQFLLVYSYFTVLVWIVKKYLLLLWIPTLCSSLFPLLNNVVSVFFQLL